MYQDLKPRFWWTKMKKEITPYIARCDNCCWVKVVHMKARLLQPLSIPGWKWEKLVWILSLVYQPLRGVLTPYGWL
jgi:hypothetical protein